ncbi:MAG: hypothetical protein HDT36_03750, partial [Clostridiales bacterium]|nr:hypothetical protein [Clostridiales bacterium]
AGLNKTASKLNLQKGKYDGQLILPTTLASIRYTETEQSVIAETLWAGDSRCYALSPDGLKLLSVDDEDDSGSITNLFYSGNAQTTLNYRKHEISKPCMLMTVSDGVFDPFSPDDHLGVEHTLLSTIRECNSTEELSDTLKRFYDEVHGDDATMAFVAFGFSDYADMQQRLAKRTDKILAIRQKYSQLYSELEVINQSEEDVSSYILTRTTDRYEYIANMIADAIARGTTDIAISQEVVNAVEHARKSTAELAKTVEEQRMSQTFNALFEYVKDNPALLASQVLTQKPVDFNGKYRVELAFENMKKHASEYIAAKNSLAAIEKEEEKLNVLRNELHRRIVERIAFYRDKFDSLWDDMAANRKQRNNLNSLLRIWQEMDIGLQFKMKIMNVNSLSEKAGNMAREVNSYIDSNAKLQCQKESKKTALKVSYSLYVDAWRDVFAFLKNNVDMIYDVINADVVRKFGLDDLYKESETAQYAVNGDAILCEMRDKKSVIIPDIVSALASNWDSASIIDGQFNATRLELFRTYYRLKSNPSSDVKILEEQLAALEAGYTSLVKL